MSKKEEALKLYYEKYLMSSKEFCGVPYEFLCANEVAVFKDSFTFKIFNVRHRIYLFIESISILLIN